MKSWRKKVWDEVEKFRDTYLTGDLSKLPVDVFSLLELRLELDLIPFEDLYENYQIEAAIRSDFTGVYVDAADFRLLEYAPEYKLKRLRFSIAHEIGHLVLHRDQFECSGFKSIEKFPEWTKSLGGKKYQIEMEANEFAGRLLVPVDQLKHAFAEFEYTAEQNLSEDWRFDEGIRRSASERIAQRFGVNAKVLEVRFTREGIWPEDC